MLFTFLFSLIVIPFIFNTCNASEKDAIEQAYLYEYILKEYPSLERQVFNFELHYRRKFNQFFLKRSNSCRTNIEYFFTPFNYNPQSIFQINYKGKTLVGKKHISDLVIKDGLPGFFCSNISENMILGYLEGVQISQNGILIFFNSISQEEKKNIFMDLINDRKVDIVYPYAQLLSGKKLERTTKSSIFFHEKYVVDKKMASSLSLGEKNIREYTISILKQLGNLSRKKVFDPACSTGEFLHTIKSNFFECYTIGQDLNPQMVNYAKDKLDEVYLGDSINNYIPEESVDFVFLGFLMQKLFPRKWLISCLILL
jgi:hypothetical protein